MTGHFVVVGSRGALLPTKLSNTKQAQPDRVLLVSVCELRPIPMGPADDVDEHATVTLESECRARR